MDMIMQYTRMLTFKNNKCDHVILKDVMCVYIYIISKTEHLMMLSANVTHAAAKCSKNNLLTCRLHYQFQKKPGPHLLKSFPYLGAHELFPFAPDSC